MWRWIAGAAGALLILAIAGIVVLGLPFQAYSIPAESMMPTLRTGDVVLVDRWAYRFGAPQRGDIVTFPPPIAEPGGANDDFIKRVIGMPGDSLKIDRGTVYVNGRPLTERYVYDRAHYDLIVKDYAIYTDEDGSGLKPLDPRSANIPPRSEWTAPDTIPPNCYLMLGDNRNNSDDSHIWGFAQNAGDFATGDKAGKSAWFTGRATQILTPSKRARSL